ncbi:hypothetical protein RHMOL_Rhmol05G0042600 [Rhododendron molle]|uniref:Uncharacterized protein n=1 Tax=Rhododendron molle TaxID=49168 RepID=A0ACC0NLM0_RHOML|nr:hypothetical protein RHMOL_Rhmol05G0042600 [Rhododendron molle]
MELKKSAQNPVSSSSSLNSTEGSVNCLAIQQLSKTRSCVSPRFFSPWLPVCSFLIGRRFFISPVVFHPLPIPLTVVVVTERKIMGFGALRSILRPVSQTLLSAHCTGSSFSLARTPAAASWSSFFGCCPLHRDIRQMPVSSAFHSLTDNQFPKRRPTDKPLRKRASLRPPASASVVVPVLCLIPCLLDLLFAGPYAWVKCVPGEPILPNQPNEGSAKRRNEKK